MVLFLNGVVQEEAPADIKMFYINHPVYRESATQLHSVPPKVVGPGPVGLLCVRQREMAITVPHDSAYLVFLPWLVDRGSGNIATVPHTMTIIVITDVLDYYRWLLFQVQFSFAVSSFWN